MQHPAASVGEEVRFSAEKRHPRTWLACMRLCLFLMLLPRHGAELPRSIPPIPRRPGFLAFPLGLRRNWNCGMPYLSAAATLQNKR